TVTSGWKRASASGWKRVAVPVGWRGHLGAEKGQRDEEEGEDRSDQAEREQRYALHAGQSRAPGRRGEQDVSTTTVQGRLRHLSPDQCEDRQQEQQFRQSTADERLDEEAVEFRELHPVLLGERDSAEPPAAQEDSVLPPDVESDAPDDVASGQRGTRAQDESPDSASDVRQQHDRPRGRCRHDGGDEVSASPAQLKQSEDECEDDRGGDRAPGHGQEQRDDLQAEQPDIVQSRTPARQVERMRNDAQEQEVPELVAIGEEAAEFE